MIAKIQLLSTYTTLVPIVLFLIVTLIAGFWAGRNVKTLKDYALANRGLGAGVLAITFLATRIHGNHLVVIPGELASDGFAALIDNVGGTIISIIIFALFILEMP